MSRIEREFDAAAPHYESNRLASWYKAHADLILGRCRPARDGDVLDVGCGTGYLLRSYLAKHPDSRGVGLDISGKMVETAGRFADMENLNNARFIQGDWETFDPRRLDAYSFELAFCANAFHYFSAPRQAARKFADTVADGGRLYVWERNKSSSALTRLWGWLHRHYIKDNVQFYTTGELQTIFSEAGFRKVEPILEVNRLFWKRKLYTSAVLIECLK